jgi:hypothetical protein
MYTVKKRNRQFKLLLREAENDLLVLQKESHALQAEIGSAVGLEEELKGLKQQWRMKEQLLRSLATRSSTEHSKKIKLLRVNLNSHIMRHKKAAKVPPVILSCTSKPLPLQDVLKNVKCRRASLSRWLSNSPNFLIEKNLIVHKQAFKLLKDIDILVNKAKKISKMRQEMNGLKKAVGDAVKFLDCNRSLISHCCSILASSLEALKPHVPEECAKVNSLSIKNDALKPETPPEDTNTQSEGGSCPEHLDNQVSKALEAIPAAESDIMLTDDDITAIMGDFETGFSDIKFDDIFLPFEDIDYTKNDSDCNRDPVVASTDKDIEVQQAVDTCSSENDNSQFSSVIEGALSPRSDYENCPSASCSVATASATASATATSSDDLVLHDLFQEACDFSTDSWSWLDPFLERNGSEDGDVPN